MENDSTNRPYRSIALSVVIVIGMTALFFGLINFREAMSSPFARDPNSAGSFKTTSQLEEERMQQLKVMDTDNDGLNDYDELYIYRTSPFLDDSDSDGDNDGQEIAVNTDPNCHKGKTCRSASSNDAAVPTINPNAIVAGGNSLSTTTSPAAGNGSSLTAPAPGAQAEKLLMEVFGDPKELTPESAETRLRQMSSTELRDFMTGIGLPPEVLAKATDEMLIKLMVDTLEEMYATSP